MGITSRHVTSNQLSFWNQPEAASLRLSILWAENDHSYAECGCGSVMNLAEEVSGMRYLEQFAGRHKEVLAVHHGAANESSGQIEIGENKGKSACYCTSCQPFPPFPV